MLSHDRSRAQAYMVHTALFVVGGWLAGCTRPPPTDSAAPVELHVSSEGEFIAFTPTELECISGQRVRLVFHHAGQRIPQKHNWVLILPGTGADIEKAATAAGEAAGWVPARDRRILAATELCSPGAESVIEFTAPKPGDYPYICTTPGHAAEMHGVLHVRPP